MIYLDNAATTYPKSENVYRAMDEANRNLAVNAGRGSYRVARNAETLIEDTRKNLLHLVCGKDDYHVVLTPSATLAMNEIIGGLCWRQGENVYVSPFEHNAVMRNLNIVANKYHLNIIELPLNKDMTIDLTKTEYLFAKKRPDKVFLSHVSNVTGYILPLEELSGLVRKERAVMIVDGSQSLGLVPVDLRKLDVDFFVFAGHKTLYGPLGIGGFFMRNEAILEIHIAGGTGTNSLNLEMPQSLPERYEPASKNIVAVAGLNAALKDMGTERKRILWLLEEQRLAKKLEKELSQIDRVQMYSVNSENRTGIVAFNIEGLNAADVGMILDEDYDIAVRTGYHCAPLIHKYLKDESFHGVVRASVGRYTTKQDVETLACAIREIAEW